MIVNLTANNKEQVLEFGYSTPLRGLMNVTSFVDSITGQTATRFFDKFFSVSIDGLRFTDYQDLTLSNIQAAVGNPIPLKNDLLIKFRYIRRGTDTTGALIVNSVVVNGTFNLAYLQVLDFQGTPYEDLAFTDVVWNTIWLNLANKAYELGIVPKYISRGEDNPKDEDYVTFWKTSSMYAALNMALSVAKIDNVYDDLDLLMEFIRERTLFVSNNEVLSNVQLLANTLHSEIRKRGTLDIVRQDGDHLTPVVNPLHGDLLRLIDYEIILDEFLFEYLSPGMAGWFLNTNSPMYKGLTNHLQLNKTPENTEDFNDLSLYTLTNPSMVSLQTDGTKQIVRLASTIGPSAIETKYIKVDPNLDYEIRLDFKKLQSTNNFTIEVEAYDQNFLLLDTYNIEDGTVRGFFIQNQNFPIGIYQTIRCILYNYNEPNRPLSDYMTNMNVGRNLRFDQSTVYLIIRLKNTLTTSGGIHLWNFKMKPLSIPYDVSFINNLDFVNIWLKNRNRNVTTIELERNIKRYLLPYSSIAKVNYLPA